MMLFCSLTAPQQMSSTPCRVMQSVLTASSRLLVAPLLHAYPRTANCETVTTSERVAAPSWLSSLALSSSMAFAECLRAAMPNKLNAEVCSVLA